MATSKVEVKLTRKRKKEEAEAVETNRKEKFVEKTRAKIKAKAQTKPKTKPKLKRLRRNLKAASPFLEANKGSPEEEEEKEEKGLQEEDGGFEGFVDPEPEPCVSATNFIDDGDQETEKAEIEKEKKIEIIEGEIKEGEEKKIHVKALFQEETQGKEEKEEDEEDEETKERQKFLTFVESFNQIEWKQKWARKSSQTSSSSSSLSSSLEFISQESKDQARLLVEKTKEKLAKMLERGTFELLEYHLVEENKKLIKLTDSVCSCLFCHCFLFSLLRFGENTLYSSFPQEKFQGIESKDKIKRDYYRDGLKPQWWSPSFCSSIYFRKTDHENSNAAFGMTEKEIRAEWFKIWTGMTTTSPFCLTQQAYSPASKTFKALISPLVEILKSQEKGDMLWREVEHFMENNGDGDRRSARSHKTILSATKTVLSTLDCFY